MKRILELTNFKEKLWTSRTWRDMSETFFDVIKVILLTTVFDHVMDGYLGKAICFSDQNSDS